MASLGLNESDFHESFTRSQGAGGQNVNKVSSCVVLTHRPTGLSVKCQEERSQALNRFIAKRRLVELIAEKIHGEISRAIQEQEKIRRQKRRRSRRAKASLKIEKQKRSEKKERRRPVNGEF